MSLDYNAYLDPALLALFPDVVTLTPAKGTIPTGEIQYDTNNTRQYNALVIKGKRLQLSKDFQLEIPEADIHLAQPPINQTTPVWAEVHDKITLPDGSTPIIGSSEIHDILPGLYLQAIRFQ